MKERMLEEVALVKWYPEWAGSARLLRLDQGGTGLVYLATTVLGYPDPDLGMPFVQPYPGFRDYQRARRCKRHPLKDPHRPYVDRGYRAVQLRRDDAPG